MSLFTKGRASIPLEEPQNESMGSWQIGSNTKLTQSKNMSPVGVGYAPPPMAAKPGINDIGIQATGPRSFIQTLTDIPKTVKNKVPPQKILRLGLLGIILIIAFVILFWGGNVVDNVVNLFGEATSGFSNIIGGETSTTAPDSSQNPAIPNTKNALQTEKTSPTQAAAENPLGEEILPKVGLRGDNSNDPGWIAMAKIEEWRISGTYEPLLIKEYLVHKKVWVRLAAFEVAIMKSELNELEKKAVAKELREKFDNGQIKRYLKRVKARDAAMYNMIYSLIFPQIKENSPAGRVATPAAGETPAPASEETAVASPEVTPHVTPTVTPTPQGSATPIPTHTAVNSATP